ncbi:hypothetical protein FRC08_014828 [Ceratobasidium sp. 394]|nr:hypothetical protein FRC08_014828 [Ceratobasidium sp. 394]
MKLLDVKSYQPPFSPLPDEIRFPTPQNFGIRWEEKETSLFNSLAANIIADQLSRDWENDPLTKSEQDELPAMAREHIRYLCRIHGDSLKPDAATLKKVRLENAISKLYENRLKVLDRFPNALMKHRNLIVQLGLQGTSSDEEGPGQPGQPKVYWIKRRQELSTRVQVLKSKLDLVYSLYFKGPGSKGSQVHARMPSEKVSKRPLKVEGLPITCLNRTWLRSLSEPEREFYRFEGHVYDYSFPDELLKQTFVGRNPDSIVLSDEEDANEEEDEEL